MKGWKDLHECGKVRHGEVLKLYQKSNGKFSLIGVNTCKKPCCPKCLPKLLRKQKKLINQAIDFARAKDLSTSMWTINLPKSDKQSLLFMRRRLHIVISDFLRTSTRDGKTKPVNKTLKKVNLLTGSVGFVYRNEISVSNSKFNPHVHLIDFRQSPLSESQKEELIESILRVCERNGVFISQRQSSRVREVILNFKEDFNADYLTKIGDNDAIKLAESDPERYEELCRSQIFLNSKDKLRIPLVYWKPGLKKMMGIEEEKFSIADNSIPIPEVLLDFMSFHGIESQKLLDLVNSAGVGVLRNENVFGLLRP